MKRNSGPGKAPTEQVLKRIRRQTGMPYVCQTILPRLEGIEIKRSRIPDATVRSVLESLNEDRSTQTRVLEGYQP